MRFKKITLYQHVIIDSKVVTEPQYLEKYED